MHSQLHSHLHGQDFQTVVADQRQTQKLLENALGVLKGFYDKAFVRDSCYVFSGGSWRCSWLLSK